MSWPGLASAMALTIALPLPQPGPSEDGAGNVRVAVEAALAFGWERYLGPHGTMVGMKGFGASGPAPDLYRHFGITAQAVAAAVKARLP